MDIERRVEILEKNFNSLIKKLSNDKLYEDADIAGVRQNVSELTPYKVKLTAYYGETEKTFYGVPEGNISVYFDNYGGDYSVQRIEDRLIVSFDALEHETQITISII